MDYATRLEDVTVLGAAGKMGSGIVLLLAMEMADLARQPANQSRRFVLRAVDVSDGALEGLVRYLREQVRRSAERRIDALRQAYAGCPELAEDRDFVERYVGDVLGLVRPATTIEVSSGSRLVFEAAPERVELKVRLLAPSAAAGDEGPWVFTNTSSIPIEEIDARSGLGGRVIGFHFYNPPAVQKLVELIPASTTRAELRDFAGVLAGRLRKTVVASRDVAGFIGNGHFMRDLLHGVAEAERLASGMPFVEAIYAVNRVSQEFLVRPMGIFQLIDYVGLDVCQCILAVMNTRLPGQGLESPLIDSLVQMEVRGGQHHDGTQKDGFLQYHQGAPVAAYDPATRRYVRFAAFRDGTDRWLGPLPASALPWKAAMMHPARDEALRAFFDEVRRLQTPGGELARRYGARSKAIGLQLVADGVAAGAEDVNRVLLTGFFHAYGPITDYL
jgi:3-hydroxyacyl-CoA dehydrogenase